MNHISELSASQISEHFFAQNSVKVQEAFSKIVAMLKLILNGDKVAANYLIIALISRVFKREGSFILGNVNINLDCVSSEQAELLGDFIGAICPMVCPIVASKESLSSLRFTPIKNYETNKMEPSIFSTLSNNTVLLFAETMLEAGEVNNNGVHNIRALATLIEE